MVEFEKLEVFQTSPDVTIVSWAFKPTNEDLAGLAADVLRSYSPESDFEKVGEAQYPQTYFRDTAMNVRDHWRKAYYRVSVAFQGRTLEMGPATAADDPSLHAKEMIRRLNVELRFSGMPVMVYLKRIGERCSACWDSRLKKATRSSCPVCFTTGYEGGYYPPILTLANKIPQEKVDQPDVTRRQPSNTSVKMSVYPILRPRDVIYFVNTRERWRIVRVMPNKVQDALTGQDPVVITELKSTDVEHTLPIPEGLDYVIEPHWEKDIRQPKDKIVHPDGEIEKIPLWRPGP